MTTLGRVLIIVLLYSVLEQHFQFTRAGGAWILQVLKGYTDDDESATLSSMSIYHRPGGDLKENILLILQYMASSFCKRYCRSPLFLPPCSTFPLFHPSSSAHLVMSDYRSAVSAL